MNSFLVWRSGRRGDVRVATVEVVDESWLTSPMKDRRAVRSVGVGKSAMDLRSMGPCGSQPMTDRTLRMLLMVGQTCTWLH